MEDWLETVKPLTQKGRIQVPYTWSVGETGSQFLTALRDEGKILANRCRHCGRVFVPPRKNCGRCFKAIDDADWLTLPAEGTITAHTTVRYRHPVLPAEPPFAYVLIKLDGAGVDFLHMVKTDLDRVTNGARVRARFIEQRSGHITDIDSFELI